jgi:thioredoxin 1
MALLTIDTNNFEEITKEWVTLIDFWAEWCWPCQMMTPIIEQFSEKVWNNMKVWKINVDENWELAQRFRVMSIPTIIIFKDWEAVETLVWVQDLAKLEEVSGKYL